MSTQVSVQDADISSIRHPQRGQRCNHHGDANAEDDDVQYHPVGPGHSNVLANDGGVRYVLVTPEMLASMNQDRSPRERIVPTALEQPQEPSNDQLALHHEKGQQIQHHEHTNSIHSTQHNDPIPYKIAPHKANPITRTRYALRQYLGEFIGTMVLIIFGNGVNCQVVLNNFTQGSYLSISFGWGIGVMFGVYVCGGVSGAHINPAVTVTLAVFRGFPWRKVPGYIIAQILGALVGSCLIQGNYHALLNQFEGGYNLRTYGLETSTAALFFTDTKPYMSNIGAFFSEVLATAVLLGLILCLSDTNNNPAPPGMNGMILLWLIVGIGATLGTETAYCLNPARDLGPRIACAMFGYPGQIWTYRNCYWIYTPIIATMLGGLIGAFVYDLFIFTGEESPLNRVWGKKRGNIMVESQAADKV